MSEEALGQTAIRRSQNCWENSFLQMLVMVLKEAGVFACFLADRGFRRTSFIALLLKQTGHSFLVRLAENVSVQAKRGSRTLRQWGLQPGRAVDLGRMAIEEQIRDTKGARFGFALVRTSLLARPSK
jgi:hypothetical protein